MGLFGVLRGLVSGGGRPHVGKVVKRDRHKFGRITIRVDVHTKDSLKAMAIKRGMNVNELVNGMFLTFIHGEEKIKLSRFVEKFRKRKVPKGV